MFIVLHVCITDKDELISLGLLTNFSSSEEMVNSIPMKPILKRKYVALIQIRILLLIVIIVASSTIHMPMIKMMASKKLQEETFIARRSKFRSKTDLQK